MNIYFFLAGWLLLSSGLFAMLLHDDHSKKKPIEWGVNFLGSLVVGGVVAAVICTSAWLIEKGMS